MDKPQISIIISNFNGLEHIKDCFDSLNNLNYKNKQIILIDNNSSDGSVDYLKKNYKNVEIIQNKRDYGFAKANNIAASLSLGKYLAFLNIDTIVDKNWLTELVKVVENSNDIGIVVSKHYYYHNKTLINFAGGYADKYLRTWHIGMGKKDEEINNTRKDSVYACFAGALITREVYKKTGLFDPLYYAYYEDVDLSLRSWILGYRVVFAPKSIIYHKTGQILGSKSKKKMYLKRRNQLRTILKIYELKTLFKIIPMFYALRLKSILVLLMKFDRLAILDIDLLIRTLLWNLFHMRSLIKYRKRIQLYRREDDKLLFDLMRQNTKFVQ